MKKETKICFYRQIAVGTKRNADDTNWIHKKWKSVKVGHSLDTLPCVAPPHREARSRQATAYALVAAKNGDTIASLQIFKPDGSEILGSVSERCGSWPLVQDFLDDPDGSMRLHFSQELNAFGEALLMRYMGDPIDPVPSFPVLTLQELHQFACIETYLGGDHPHFWQSYGFEDSHRFFVTLNPPVDDLWAIGLAFETQSVWDLRELRFSVDPHLIPFVYGALRDDLTDISAERELISDRKDLSDSQKTTHIYWLYQAVKTHLTPVRMGAEWMDILSAKTLSEASRIGALAGLYQAVKTHLTPVRMGTERMGILSAKTLSKTCRIGALEVLYTACAEQLTTENIMGEKSSIRALRLTPDLYTKAVLSLYRSCGAKVTPEMVLDMHDEIVASTMGNRAKSENLEALRRICHGYFAARCSQLWTSEMPHAERASRLGLFYHKGASVLTADALTADALMAERSRILDSNLPDVSKYHVLCGLYCGGASKFTTAEWVAERFLVMSLPCDDREKAKLLGSLYQGGAVNFTFGRVQDERDEIVSSTMIDRYKGVSLGALYHACAIRLTGDEIVSERIKILDPNNPGSWKLISLRHLYRACKDQLTPDSLIKELVNVRAVGIHTGSDVGYIVRALCDISNVFTPDMIVASLQAMDWGECRVQYIQDDSRNSWIHERFAAVSVLTQGMGFFDRAKAIVACCHGCADALCCHGCADALTPEGVSFERAEIMASGFPHQSIILGELYRIGLPKMGALHRIQELNVILATRMMPYETESLLSALGFGNLSWRVEEKWPNGTVLVGSYYGDRGYGYRGFVGPVKEIRPDGSSVDGIFRDRGNGQWGFVGPVKETRPDGAVVEGTFCDRGNGRWGFVGPVKEIDPDGTVWDGIYGDDGYGRWRYIPSPKYNPRCGDPFLKDDISITPIQRNWNSRLE